MSNPGHFNHIVDALEVGLEGAPAEQTTRLERPFVLGVVPPKSLRCIVTFMDGSSYSVTIESADAQPEATAG